MAQSRRRPAWTSWLLLFRFVGGDRVIGWFMVNSKINPAAPWGEVQGFGLPLGWTEVGYCSTTKQHGVLDSKVVVKHDAKRERTPAIAS